jgi:diguanylate cyclase (GGDEF)-like protein
VVRHDDGWLRGVAGSDGIVEVVPCGPPTGLEAAVSGEPTLVDELDPLGTLGAALPGATTVVLVPVEVDDDVLGVMAAEWPRRRRRVPAVTVRSLARAAGHAALTLRHQALVAEVERLATHDPLTGLSNRRSFEDVLDREIKRARRRNEPLTLAMVDIDHFKSVNDSFGHPTGDAVLRAVATALVVNTKSFDVVARLGGDEFAVILPTCAASDAPSVAERLRRVCSEAAVTLQVTVSVGWAGCPEDGIDTLSLVAAADSALYAAKRAGRDRVAAASQVDAATSPAASSRKRR